MGYLAQANCSPLQQNLPWPSECLLLQPEAPSDRSEVEAAVWGLLAFVILHVLEQGIEAGSILWLCGGFAWGEPVERGQAVVRPGRVVTGFEVA
jgi:hypothetical protein